MKMTKRSAVEAYKLLEDANLKKLDFGEKIAVTKVLRALRPLDKEAESFKKEIEDKLKPEGFDEKAKKAGAGELSQAEIMGLNQQYAEYRKAVDDCLESERNTEVEVKFKPMGRDVLEKLVESNEDYTAGKIMLLEDVLVG